jgi:tRNA A22 N-methylase
VFSALACTGKIKQHLLHFLDLPVCEENQVAITDIGCDHAILSFTLLFSGRYSSIIGVDASKTANMKKLGLSQNLPIAKTHSFATQIEF